MRSCVVSMQGKDGKIHSVSVTASSLFDAADQAAKIWHGLWWYARSFKIHVEDYEGNTWNVTPERLRRWRESQQPPASNEGSLVRNDSG